MDEWYRENIVNKNLENYLADTGFCNDRSFYKGDGISTSIETAYNAFRRANRYEPTFKCTNQNDLFTVSNDGNKALTYPIGLITIDEVMYGGEVNGHINRLGYLRASGGYRTMSPIQFNIVNNTAMVYDEGTNGYPVYSYVDSIGYIRPVINLSKDVEITRGIGTVNDPFVVKIN